MKLNGDFEGANVENIKYANKSHVIFSARKAESPGSLWFCFKAEGVKGKKVTFEFENAYNVKNDSFHIDDPENWPVARPVYSYDMKHFRRIRSGIYKGGSYIFSHYFTQNEVFISYSYPYVYSDLKDFIKSMHDNPYCKIRTIGKSQENRDLYYLQVTDFSSKKTPKGIWITARQHAGETPGSYACEGMIKYLTGTTKTAAGLRDKYIFNFIPMLDVDNAYKGNYGKDSLPVDFNRDWNESSMRPEVCQIKELINGYAKNKSFDLYLDLHAPGMSQGHHYISGLDMNKWTRHSKSKEIRFMKLLEKYTGYSNPYILGDGGYGAAGMACVYFHNLYGILSLILEISYHRTVKNSEIYVTPTSLRKYGVSVLKTISSYFDASQS